MLYLRPHDVGHEWKLPVRTLLLITSISCAALNASLSAVDLGLTTPGLAESIIAGSYLVFLIFLATALSLIVGFGLELYRGAKKEDAEVARRAATARLAMRAAALASKANKSSAKVAVLVSTVATDACDAEGSDARPSGVKKSKGRSRPRSRALSAVSSAAPASADGSRDGQTRTRAQRRTHRRKRGGGGEKSDSSVPADRYLSSPEPVSGPGTDPRRGATREDVDSGVALAFDHAEPTVARGPASRRPNPALPESLVTPTQPLDANSDPPLPALVLTPPRAAESSDSDTLSGSNHPAGTSRTHRAATPSSCRPVGSIIPSSGRSLADDPLKASPSRRLRPPPASPSFAVPPPCPTRRSQRRARRGGARRRRPGMRVEARAVARGFQRCETPPRDLSTQWRCPC